MADNNKINVDFFPTADEKKQIDDYAKSFESLRNSINGLSQPLNTFSNSINTLDKSISKYTESLGKINDQHKEFVTTGEKVNEKVLSASSSFTSWIGVVRLFVDVMKGWQVALTGGLSVVTSFLSFWSVLSPYQHSRVCGDNLDHKQKEYPVYFKGIKDEDILNGNAKKNYQDITKSIFENAKAKFFLLIQFSYIYQYY